MKNSNIIKSPLLKAINPKNQSLVNKAINWIVKHNRFVVLRDIAEGEDEKAFSKWNKKCEISFDKFLENMDELPKGQQQSIYNSNFY